MKTINYKGKGEHSVNELELIIEQQAEELYLIKSRQKPLIIDSVSNTEGKLQAVEDLIEFARNNCREWNNDEMEEIIDRL